MEINVRLRGGGGGNGRQSKLSAKHTSKNAKQLIRQTSNSNSSSVLGGAGKTFKSAMGGAKSMSKALPVVGGIALALQGISKVVNIGANVFESHTGDSMMAKNIKAYASTGSSFGLNLVYGSVENWAMVEPRVRRQNYEKDYGRDLYYQNGYSEKNKLT